MYDMTPSALEGILGGWASGADPLNEQLAAAIARAIELGDLPAGTRLPAERQLAAQLGLSRTTIVSAYDRLRSAGLVRSRQGSGTRVAQRRPGLTTSYLDEVPASGPAPATRAVRTGAPPPQPFAGEPPSVGLMTPDVDDAIELTIGAMPAVPEVFEATAAVLREDLPALMADAGYDPFGLPALRVEIAAHLRRHGVPTTPDQVLVTTGAQQAIALIAAQLGGPDATVVLENPTYIGAIDAFRAAGNRLVPIPVDEHGGRVDVVELLAAGGPLRLVYVVPTFQNPTGSVMPEERRRRLVRAAHDLGFLVVEDLTTDPAPAAGHPPPLASFDPDERVITIGSLSKLAWGGLRIGWIRAARPLVARLLAGKIVADHSTSVVTQAIGARLFPDLGSIAERSERRAAERRDVLTTALAERLPEWRWTAPRGGLSLWVRLPGADATAFTRLAAEHGVIVRPGPVASPDGGYRDHVRIAYGAEPVRLVEGVERLARAWEAYAPAARQARPSISVSV